MGFWGELFFGIMNQTNDNNQQNYHRGEPSFQDYIRSEEIEENNYDEEERNDINDNGKLSKNN